MEEELPFKVSAGRSTWLLLHTMVYKVHDQDTLNHYISAVLGILALYPCDECRGKIEKSPAFSKHVEKLRVHTWNRTTPAFLKIWALVAHDTVSEMKGVEMSEDLKNWKQKRHTLESAVKLKQVETVYATLDAIDARWKV